MVHLKGYPYLWILKNSTVPNWHFELFIIIWWNIIKLGWNWWPCVSKKNFYLHVNSISNFKGVFLKMMFSKSVNKIFLKSLNSLIFNLAVFLKYKKAVLNQRIFIFINKKQTNFLTKLEVSTLTSFHYDQTILFANTFN